MWPPKHQTVDAFLARVKARYSVAKGARAAAISTWLMDALDAVTPAEAGHIRGRVVVGEPSITVYVDPQIRT